MDLAVLETLDGGDLQKVGSDMAMVYGLENQVYLALFGGNPGYPTTTDRDSEAFDWWGNKLFMRSEPSQQFNSLFEKKMLDVALTSQGRVELEEAAKKDLEFLKEVATITVSVTIVSDDHIRLYIKMIILDSAETKITVVDFKRKESGDFYLFDFNDDFNL